MAILNKEEFLQQYVLKRANTLIMTIDILEVVIDANKAYENIKESTKWEKL